MNNIFEHYLMGERVYTNTMLPVCEKHSVNFTELAVIMFLANNPSLDTASDIVKCRNIAKSHVSVSVAQLELRGIITKAYMDGNRRSVHLKLTDAAKPIVTDGRLAQESFGNILFEGVTEAERDAMTKIFYKIDCNLRQHSKGGSTSC